MLRELMPGDQILGSISFEQAQTIVGLIHEISQTLARYAGKLFLQDLMALEAALAPARGSMLAQAWAAVTNPAYRQACAAARALRQVGPAPAPQLQREIAAAADQANRWRALFPLAPIPQAPLSADAAQRAIDPLQHDLTLLAPALQGRSFGSLPLGTCAASWLP